MLILVGGVHSGRGWSFCWGGIVFWKGVVFLFWGGGLCSGGGGLLSGYLCVLFEGAVLLRGVLFIFMVSFVCKVVLLRGIFLRVYAIVEGLCDR